MRRQRDTPACGAEKDDQMTNKDKRTGPEPDRSKPAGNWKETMKVALRKKKPASNWPKQPDLRHR
jgi:hypothetical protein